MIRIRSRKPGFRRCGVAHPAEWIEHPDDAFSAEQLEILSAEPMLQVETIEDRGADPDDAGKKSRKKD